MDIFTLPLDQMTLCTIARSGKTTENYTDSPQLYRAF